MLTLKLGKFINKEYLLDKNETVNIINLFKIYYKLRGFVKVFSSRIALGGIVVHRS